MVKITKLENHLVVIIEEIDFFFDPERPRPKIPNYVYRFFEYEVDVYNYIDLC